MEELKGYIKNIYLFIYLFTLALFYFYFLLFLDRTGSRKRKKFQRFAERFLSRSRDTGAL